MNSLSDNSANLARGIAEIVAISNIYDMQKEDLSAAIQRERQDAGLTVSALARQVGCGESTIRKVEMGHCPSVVLADAICKALGRRLVIGSVHSRKAITVGGTVGGGD